MFLPFVQVRWYNKRTCPGGWPSAVEGGAMKSKHAVKIAGYIFLLVAVLHFIRFYFQIPLIIGTYYVPLRYSALGFLVAFLIAIFMFRSNR